MKLSAQSEGYQDRLLAEWLSGKPNEDVLSYWMERGREMEEEALSWYMERHRAVNARRVGFVYLDEDKMIGCSPDLLVDDDTIVEVKCPKRHNHMRTLRRGEMPIEHKPQAQGALWITGRYYCDFVSYHPDMAQVVIRVERDEEYIAKLKDVVGDFVEGLLIERQQLIARGFEPKEFVIHEASPAVMPPETKEWLGAILAAKEKK